PAGEGRSPPSQLARRITPQRYRQGSAWSLRISQVRRGSKPWAESTSPAKHPPDSFTFIKPNLMLPVGTSSFPVPRKWLPVTSLLARKNSLIDVPGNSSLRALKFLQHCAAVFMKLAGFLPNSLFFPAFAGNFSTGDQVARDCLHS